MAFTVQGTVSRVASSISTLNATSATLEPLARGLAVLRATVLDDDVPPIRTITRSAAVEGGSFSITFPDLARDEILIRPRLIVYETLTQAGVLVQRPLFRSNDLRAADHRLDVRVRVLDADELEERGIDALLDEDELTERMSGSSGELRITKVKTAGGRVRVDFDASAGIKGKVLVEPAPSTGTETRRLVKLTYVGHDLFGFAGIGEALLEDRIRTAVRDAQADLNASYADTLNALALLYSGATVTLPFVEEPSAGVKFSVAVGVARESA